VNFYRRGSMKKFIFLGFLLGLSTLLVFTGSSKAGVLTDFEFSIGAIQQKPSGFVSYKAGSSVDHVDVRDDVHLGDKAKPWVKLKLEHSIPLIPNIKLAYMPMKFDGGGELTRDIKWGRHTYQAKADFDLSVKFDRVDMTLYYNIPFIKKATAGKVDMEVGLNVRTIMLDGKLSGKDRNTGESISESKSLTLPIPMGHLAVEFKPIRPVSLVGELNFIGYNKNTYYDYVAGVRVNAPMQTLLKPFVEVGYRYERLKIDEQDVKTDWKTKGVYGMVGVRF
jgi:outer membrane protein